MSALPPDLEAALAARLRYYRDLGVFSLYRRCDPDPELDMSPASQTKYKSESAISAAGPSSESSLVTPSAAAAPAADRHAALEAIRADIGDCTRCPLAFQGRHTIVFADGDPNARLMFVGEGPGADEDAQGLPFVGRAGQLLNNMITAMGLQRSEVYIANVVKCRPPQNRTPEPDEANTCMQFLWRQIDVVRPQIIVALGSTAATYLLGAKSSLAGLRGRIHQVRESQVIVTYHPAYLLRDPRQKAEAWKDLQIAMKELGLTPPKPAKS
jgi:uracil-DNA glycosylase family 4